MAYTLQELIDIKLFQNLLDRLHTIYGFPSTIIGVDGTILTATAWQDICIKFHRKNKESEKCCRESDRFILDHIHEANPAVYYRCPHGLMDMAAPIIIDGVHYGNFFTGQILTQTPEPDRFKAQAEKYGYDESAYLEALQGVPIWTEDKLDNLQFLISSLIALISEMGSKKLRELERSEAIMVREDLYQSILQTAMDGFCVADSDGKLIEVNDTYCEMTGFTRSELLGRQIRDLDALKDPASVSRHLETVMTRGKDRFETRHYHSDNTVFDVEISIQFRAIDGGRFICFIRDISEALKNREELRKNKDMLNQVINAVPQSIFWKDRDSRFLGCNRVFAEVVGINDPDRIIGLTDFDLPVPAENAEAYRADDLEVMQSHQPKRHIIEPILHANGKHLWVDTSKAPLYDDNGNPIGLLGIFEDITERKEMEEKQEELQLRLLQSQRLESLGRLAGGIAHDFNNMLTVIYGNSQLMLRKMDPQSPLVKKLRDIIDATRQSMDLTSQLLGFARKQTAAPRALDLNSVIDQMLRMLARLIGEDVHLSFHPFPGLWPVKIDPSQVNQILTNLCANARDGINGVGDITLETMNTSLDADYAGSHVNVASGDYVCLTVSDTGEGMDPGTIDNLFEPFFTTKDAGKGTGLGLATVYGIVQQNNGSIDVYSEKGAGSTFRIYLPRYKEAGQVDSSSELPGQTTRGSETILLVEDERRILTMAASMLEYLGYTVLAASGAAEAIELFNAYTGTVDLLLTDVVMPEMSGKDLAETIRRNRPGLKVLYASGYTDDVIAHRGILEGGIHFIGKPFSIQTLSEKIREVLNSRP